MVGEDRKRENIRITDIFIFKRGNDVNKKIIPKIYDKVAWLIGGEKNLFHYKWIGLLEKQNFCLAILCDLLGMVKT